jgi:peroxiredoxin
VTERPERGGEPFANRLDPDAAAAAAARRGGSEAAPPADGSEPATGAPTDGSESATGAPADGSEPATVAPADGSESVPPPDADRPPRRLDPDFAAATAGETAREHVRSPVIDTRPYRWMIGIFGLVLVLIISVYQFVARGVGTVGVPAGKQLHGFASPLANSTLQGDSNLNPPCTLAKHDRRALNVCLILKHQPLVLTLFVPSSSDCTREVDTLQTVSTRFRGSGVAFAAVAVRGGHAQTAALIRSHHWTIPVAYDLDGAVGVAYGVETCPMIELAQRGGIVANRLIGNHWLAPAALAAQVRALANHPG